MKTGKEIYVEKGSQGVDNWKNEIVNERLGEMLKIIGKESFSDLIKYNSPEDIRTNYSDRQALTGAKPLSSPSVTRESVSATGK